jgi:hypothetical protein
MSGAAGTGSRRQPGVCFPSAACGRGARHGRWCRDGGSSGGRGAPRREWRDGSWADGRDSGHSPQALLVDTSLAGQTQPGHVWDEVIDYSAIRGTSRWLRFGEQLSRLDFSLARCALREASRFDILVAGSEKVGIPLALMSRPRPLICIVHQVASPAKRTFLKALNIPSRWIRVGYQCTADRELLESFYGVPAERLVQFKAAPLETFRPGSPVGGDCVLSVGTSKRDYRTLFAALEGLPGW